MNICDSFEPSEIPLTLLFYEGNSDFHRCKNSKELNWCILFLSKVTNGFYFCQNLIAITKYILRI